MSGDSSFISDRRDPANTTWDDDSDWAEGTAEGVNIVNDQLVGQTVSRVLYNEGENKENWVEGLTEGDPESPLGGTLTKEADHLFADPAPAPDDDNGVSWVYSDIIDFSGYTELVVESASQELKGMVQIMLTPEVQIDFSTLRKYYIISEDEPYSRKTDTIDISAISGEYYLHVVARDNAVFTKWPSEAEFYYVGLR